MTPNAKLGESITAINGSCGRSSVAAGTRAPRPAVGGSVYPVCSTA
jgi:hypothetical protein